MGNSPESSYISKMRWMLVVASYRRIQTPARIRECEQSFVSWPTAINWNYSSLLLTRIYSLLTSVFKMSFLETVYGCNFFLSNLATCAFKFYLISVLQLKSAVPHFLFVSSVIESFFIVFYLSLINVIYFMIPFFFIIGLLEKEGKVCHPKIFLSNIRIILSWLFLRNDRHRKSFENLVEVLFL